MYSERMADHDEHDEHRSRASIPVHDNETHKLLRELIAKTGQSGSGQTNTQLTQMENRIMATLDDLTSAVAADATVTQSAITLLQGLAAQLAAAGTDPVALAALVDEINANTQALADAVVANTPAA